MSLLAAIGVVVVAGELGALVVLAAAGRPDGEHRRATVGPGSDGAALIVQLRPRMDVEVGLSGVVARVARGVVGVVSNRNWLMSPRG